MPANSTPPLSPTSEAGGGRFLPAERQRSREVGGGPEGFPRSGVGGSPHARANPLFSRAQRPESQLFSVKTGFPGGTNLRLAGHGSGQEGGHLLAGDRVVWAVAVVGRRVAALSDPGRGETVDVGGED